MREIAAIETEGVERGTSAALPSRPRDMAMRRAWPLLDRRLAQGGVIIGAFATAAVLAALYGPGPREAASVPQAILPPATTPAAAGTLDNSAAPVPAEDEATAKETARRKIAEALYRQAEESSATAPATPPRPDIAPVSPPPPAPKPAAANSYEQDFTKLASKAAQAVQIGDIAGARLILEHAVDAGDATAIYALAETYDPRVLAKLHVRGMTGDADKARALYEQALAKGIQQAKAKLDPAAQ